MYDSFWDWKINNQFEVDPVIQIAGLRFDVRRKSRVAGARLRPAAAPRLGSDLSQRVLRPACVARKVGPNLCRWKGEPGSRGSVEESNAVICVINIIISAHFKPVKTTLAPREPSRDLQGRRGGFEASREGKRSCRAIGDPSQSSTKETVSPLLSLHRSNYCSSAGVAFRSSMRAAPRASCIHARREWTRGDRREKS